MAKAKASLKKPGARSPIKARRDTSIKSERASKKLTAGTDKKSQSAKESVQSKAAEGKRPKALTKRLEDTFKKHRLAKLKNDAKNLYAPPKRRGRRPKMETEDGEVNEEGETQEAPPQENDPIADLQFEGIRVDGTAEDGLMNIDKFEDYDEELNFDA